MSHPALPSALLLSGLLLCGAVRAEERHWVGGSGQWNDRAHWSATANGATGVSVPGPEDAVFIEPGAALTVQLGKNTELGDLTVLATHGPVTLQGSGGRMRVNGGITLRGSVVWAWPGLVELTAGNGLAELDLHGIPLGGDLRFTGGGTWSMRSDLVLGDRGTVVLDHGTLATNGNMLRAGRLRLADRGAKLMAGSSVVFLAEPVEGARHAVDPGTSRLLVGGVQVEWGPLTAAAGEARAQNVCATAVGQTPFVIDAQLMSNYNGYGVSCHGVCNGKVRVVVTGGVGPFVYNWVGGPSTALWNNVCPGNQIVIVTDQGQGVSCATTVQVTDPALLSVIFTGTTPPSCAGVCNGSSTVFAVGGVPGYSYSWNNGAGTGASFNQLCPGSNHLRVTDANDCSFDSTFVFPVQPIQPHLTTTDVQCANACDGTAQVAPTGGSGSFTYNWGPGNPAGDGTSGVTGLCAGNYTVTIQDANGCDTTLQFQITQPPPIVPNATHVDATCGGLCDGTASVVPTGGSGSYSYSWSPTPGGGGGSATATGLCEGQYTVTITDNASGCDTVVAITIDAPPAIVPTPASTNATCATSCNGTASAPATGGIAALTYTWTPNVNGQGTPNAVQLCPGTYSVLISDGTCDTTVQFTITAPPPISPSITITQASCAGQCDGAATVVATGGSGTLTYNWQPGNPAGDGTPSVTGLCAGAWSVTISDANGCDTTLQFTITEPPPLTLTGTKTNVTCGGSCNGTATVNATGGTPGYTFVWSPVPPQGQGTASVSQLCAGTWTVTVTDAHGCQKVRTYNIQAPPVLEAFITATPASCPGVCDGSAQAIASGGTPLYTYTWTPTPSSGQGSPGVSGLCPGPGTLTVSDAAGCDTTIAFLIDAPAPIVVDPTETDASCSGSCDGSIVLSTTGGSGAYTYAWTPSSAGSGASATNLCPGIYQVTVTSGSCDTTLNFTINQPPPLAVDLVTTPASCADACDGTASLTGDLAGLNFQWQPEPGGGQGTASATGLCAGSYTVTATNAAGCDTVISFSITAPPALVLGGTQTDLSCSGNCNGTATVTPSGGSPGYTYSWSPVPPQGQGTATASQLCAGTWTVTVTDANGCQQVRSFTIQTSNPLQVFLTPSAVSCADVCDGSAIAVVSGGTPLYNYAWTPEPGSGQGTPGVGGLCAGPGTLTVSDAGGCDTTLAFTIDAPPPIAVDATVTNAGCNGACTGSIVLNSTGGTGTYTYTWAPASAGTGATANNLCVGSYQVTIASGGCDTTLTFNIVQPAPVAVSAIVTASHCNLCVGAVMLHTTGGNPPYTFNWGAPLNITTTDSVLSGLCAGLYTVFVTDVSGCSTQLAVPITDDDGEVLDMTDGVTSCPANCDGVVAVTYACSAAPCTVAWTDLQGNVLSQGLDTLTGLCVGSYIATVTNGNGCISIDTAQVVPPVPFTANITSTQVSCAGDCNGIATIGISGSIGPFTYTWSPAPGGGQGTPQATGLCPDSYDVLVHEQGGCDVTFSVLITAPAPITVDATTTDITCAGQCNGSISLNVQGGTGPFLYNWAPMPPVGQGTPAVSGLCAGTYTLALSDVNGCDTTLSFTINEPLPLAATSTSTQSHCGACDGTANVSISGGTGPYGIQWSNAGGSVGSGPALTGLCAGIYTVVATDDHGCTITLSVVVTDANGELINAVNGQTLCSNACDGQVSVSYNCTNAPCTVAWFAADGSPLAQGTDTLAGLCAGTYLVQVLNAAGCTTVDTALVVPSQVIIPNLSTTPVDCSNLCNGTATVGPVGGVAPYTYIWTPAPGGGQNTPQATGLCAGTYQVAIADASGCDTVVNVLITAPQPLAVQAATAQVSCSGACDGSIVLSPSGGNGFYTYAWTPEPPSGPGSNGAFNLCAGTWSVTVADDHGCDTTLSFTITEPAPLTATTANTLSSCNVCNGTATVVPSGGTAPYTVTWTQGGSPAGSGDTLTGLCAGVYSAHVVDAHGCFMDLIVAVSDAGGETLATSDFTLTCPDQCNGVVDVVFNCSVPACTITWFDANGNDLNEPGNTLSNLCAGSYFVQVANGAGCTTIDTAYVIAPAPITANLSTTPVTCAGNCDGTATVGPTGGAGGYQIDWVLGSGSASGTPHVVDLCPGSYQVTITDLAGCSITQDVLITAPPPITAAAVVVPVTCNGACDGSINVMGQGGTGSLQYQWSPEPGAGQGTATATGLCAGAWTVNIADANGCDTTFTLTLTDPPVLNVSLAHTDNVCYTDCNATAHADVTGGVAPYAITWAGPGGATIDQDTVDVAGLCGGNYTLTVTDARGCISTTSFTVATGAPLVANLVFQGESCNGPCDGSAAVAPTGGSGLGYTYLWQPGNPTGQGTDQVSGLCAGNWTVTITDNLGCDSTYAFTIAPYTPITAVATVQQVQCNGACNGSISLGTTGGIGALTYVWTPDPGAGQGTANASGLCPGSYTVLISDAVGCDTTLTYNITEPAALTLLVDSVVAASCNSSADGAIAISIAGGTPGYTLGWTGPAGFSSSDEDIMGLVPGTYQLIVTDLNGCQQTTSVDVGTTNGLTANAGPDLFLCSGSTVVLDGSASQGAVTYQWTDSQGGVVGTGATADPGNLPDGTHIFILMVANGPCTDADTVMVTMWPTPFADAGPDQVIYVQGSIGLGGSPAGPPGSSFVWQPDSLLDHPNAENPTATLDSTTWFVLTVISPEGCFSTDSVLVTVVPEVKVPSGFTPNGDGHNDSWVLDFAPLFPQIDVQVFSRWGEPLFRSVGYHTPWDGKYDGKLVPMGTYYYVIELHDPRFPDALTGPLTVIR
jgi:gliding motility-associated-like protein